MNAHVSHTWFNINYAIASWYTWGRPGEVVAAERAVRAVPREHVTGLSVRERQYFYDVLQRGNEVSFISNLQLC